MTHYSALKPTPTIIAGLHEQIDDFVMLTQQAADSEPENFEKALEQSITEYIVRRCQNQLPDLDLSTIQKWVSLDASLNAQGLAFWWQHKRQAG